MFRIARIASLIVLVLAAAGCRKAKPIVIGSKASTEQALLGEIMAQHVEHRLNQKVTRNLNLGSTALTYEALLAGNIDAYPEYTGVAQMAILRVNLVPDREIVYDRVREMYKSNLQMDWMSPLGFEPAAVMVVRKEDAEKFQLKTLSDAEKREDGWALGVTYDFQERPDGMGSLNRAYRLPSRTSPVILDLGHLYYALDQKQVSMIPGTTTDGLLDPAKYVALLDDRTAFPPYQACIVARLSSEAKFPGLREALNELSGKFTEAKVKEMNRRVDAEKQPLARVASQFLSEAGLK